MKCPSCKRELRVSAKELNCDCGASWSFKYVQGWWDGKADYSGPDEPEAQADAQVPECDERGSVKLDTLKEVKATHDGVGLILGHELRKLAKAVVHYETLDFGKSQYIALRMRLIADHIAPPKAEVQAPHKKVTHIDYTGEIR